MSIFLRVLVAITSIVFLCFVVQMIRHERFLLKYSFLWLLLGILGFIAVLFPDLVIGLSSVLGFETPVNFLFFACIVILMGVALTLCAVVSRLVKRVTSLTQEVSLLKSGGDRELKIETSTVSRID